MYVTFECHKMKGIELNTLDKWLQSNHYDVFSYISTHEGVLFVSTTPTSIHFT